MIMHMHEFDTTVLHNITHLSYVGWPYSGTKPWEIHCDGKFGEFQTRESKYFNSIEKFMLRSAFINMRGKNDNRDSLLYKLGSQRTAVNGGTRYKGRVQVA